MVLFLEIRLFEIRTRMGKSASIFFLQFSVL